jgi:hypothetical protein
MELRDALDQISEIRERMARGQVFRGYRSVTTAMTSVIAVLTSAAQAQWVTRPARDVDDYLWLWCAAAVASLIVVGSEMAFRAVRSGSALHRQMTMLAVDQFVPCLVAGALVTYAIGKFAGGIVWIMPGLWAVLFSLGVFASRRFLPRGVGIVAGYYLLAGLICLAVGGRDQQRHVTLWPWTMAIVFGTGQLLAAGVLWWTLERNHGRDD